VNLPADSFPPPSLATVYPRFATAPFQRLTSRGVVGIRAPRIFLALFLILSNPVSGDCPEVSVWMACHQGFPKQCRATTPPLPSDDRVFSFGVHFFPSLSFAVPQVRMPIADC